MIEDKHTLVKYVTRAGRKVGAMVACCNEEVFAIGISKCNFSAGDQFDKTIGVNTARERAINAVEGTRFPCKVPASMSKDYDKFLKRCQRYYKGKRRCSAADFIPE